MYYAYPSPKQITWKWKKRVLNGGLPFTSIANFSPVAGQKRGNPEKVVSARGEIRRKIELENEVLVEKTGTEKEVVEAIQQPHRQT